MAVMLMWLCGILHKQYGGVWWVWTSNCFLHINFLWLTLIGLCQNLLDSVIKNYSCKPMLRGNIGRHTWIMHQLICHTSFLLIVYFLSGYRVLQTWRKKESTIVFIRRDHKTKLLVEAQKAIWTTENEKRMISWNTIFMLFYVVQKNYWQQFSKL